MSLVAVQATLTVIVSVSLAHKDAVFVQKPQNHTLFDLKRRFTLNCSTDIASEYGMDWVVRINGIRERVCSSQSFHINASSSCQLNYSMEVPNNRTLNLVVDPQIASLGDEYCCQFDNGAGKKSCSYLNIPLTVTSGAVGGLTADANFADTTTVIHYRNNTELEESPDNTVTYIVVGVILGVLVITIIVVAVCLILRKRRSKESEMENGTGMGVRDLLNGQKKDLKNQSCQQ